MINFYICKIDTDFAMPDDIAMFGEIAFPKYYDLPELQTGDLLLLMGRADHRFYGVAKLSGKIVTDQFTNKCKARLVAKEKIHTKIAHYLEEKIADYLNNDDLFFKKISEGNFNELMENIWGYKNFTHSLR